MNVRLIAITQPVIDNRCITAEQLIVYAARVSNPANQDNHATGPKLLSYCIRNGHWSVFETASMTVEITTSRAIAAQLLRHRSFTFQEFSQRYAQVAEMEHVELRTQDTKNRQGSGEIIVDDALQQKVLNAMTAARSTYDDLIVAGVSRETARMVLPMATTTVLFMTGNVRSWIHYLQQRMAPGTQKEHRQIAQAIRGIFAQQFPTIANLL